MASLALQDDDFAWITAEVAALGVPTVSVLKGGYNPNPSREWDWFTLTLALALALTLTLTLTRCSRAAITWVCSRGACAATWTHSFMGMAMGDADC